MPSTPMSPAPTEKQIADLVRVFYGHACAHPELGTVFNTAVADWKHHLRVVQDFWSHTLLRSGRYNGHPYPAHIDLSIRREHFEQWLQLFREAAAQTLPAQAAAQAIAKAEHMAESFRAGLFPFDPVRPRRGDAKEDRAGRSS
jgi:hemoglobin